MLGAKSATQLETAVLVKLKIDRGLICY